MSQPISESDILNCDLSTSMPACFTAPDTVDAWRHRRMHEMLNPLIDANPAATWMTVGAGNYGSDAFFLQGRGIDVLASSVCDDSLKISLERGHIQKYACVNAEEIPYPDEAFNIVLCKEAYHHFRRPAVAFYEMLRVAKDAVVLIEPYDGPKRFLDRLKEPMKKLLWGKNETIYFEPSGNYIYRIHPKDMGKKLAAMGYAAVAYKTFNDIYLPQFGAAKMGKTGGYWITRLAIFIQNILGALRLLNPGLVVMVSFKKLPETQLESSLKTSGFRCVHLPVNPYV